MRQTLFRLLLGDLFAFRTVPNDPNFIGWGPGLYLGAGWLLLPWLLYAFYWVFVTRRQAAAEGNKLPIPGVLIAFPVVILIGLPLLTWVFKINPDGIPVYGYGFMLFLAFLIGGANAVHRAKRDGLPGDLIWDIGLWTFFAGIVGSRLFHLIQYWDQNFGDVNSLSGFLFQAINLSQGGMVLYGGLLLGLVTYLWMCWRRKYPPLYLADIMVPSAFIGLALGRVGCLLNGCCYGDFCTQPWAIAFPKGSVPYSTLANRGEILEVLTNVVRLQPTQVYSTLNGLILYLVCSLFFRRRSRDGEVLALGMILYPISRFTIEFLRMDEPGRFGTSLTISQWVSAGLFVVGLILLLWLRTRPRLITEGTLTRRMELVH